MYSNSVQCANIILGGSHDNGYARILSKLEAGNVEPGKVILLQGPTFAPELERFDSTLFPRVKFDGLFMERKIDPGQKYAQVAANGVLPMQRKSTSSTSSPPKSPSVQPNRLVEPDLGNPHHLPQQLTNRVVGVWLSIKNLQPRACNMYYLNAQKCGKSDCEYSHEHILNETQLSALRYNCKKQPCHSFHKFDSCPYGDDCIYGHECPDNVGGKCTSGKKCKLSHPVQGSYI